MSGIHQAYGPVAIFVRTLDQACERPGRKFVRKRGSGLFSAPKQASLGTRSSLPRAGGPTASQHPRNKPTKIVPRSPVSGKDQAFHQPRSRCPDSAIRHQRQPEHSLSGQVSGVAPKAQKSVRIGIRHLLGLGGVLRYRGPNGRRCDAGPFC